ncbi:MAG: major coat protein [Candidatus Bathyarchaeia archaeon]
MNIKIFTKKVGLGAVLAMAVTSPAFAALDEGIATGLTGIQTDSLALQGLLWPVVIAVTAGFVMFKIFKRGASKI